MIRLLDLFNFIIFNYPSNDPCIIIHTTKFYIEYDQCNYQLFINIINGNDCKLIVNITFDNNTRPIECRVCPIINGKCQYENSNNFSVYKSCRSALLKGDTSLDDIIMIEKFVKNK